MSRGRTFGVGWLWGSFSSPPAVLRGGGRWAKSLLYQSKNKPHRGREKQKRTSQCCRGRNLPRKNRGRQPSHRKWEMGRPTTQKNSFSLLTWQNPSERTNEPGEAEVAPSSSSIRPLLFLFHHFSSSSCFVCALLLPSRPPPPPLPPP